MKYVSYSDAVKRRMMDAISKLCDAAGETVSTRAKLNSPVDTGLLKNSIDYDPAPTQKRVSIGTNVVYAPYVELGTSRQKAQPYLEPAALQSQSDIKRLGDIIMRDILGGV